MGRRIWQPHDRFFKLLLEQPEIAKALLHERLPSALVERFADVNPMPFATEFVGERLRSVLADKVFQVPLREVSAASQLCVIEHKSFMTPGFRFQMLKDLAGLWQHLDLQRLAEVSAVTALVVYHGNTRWEGGERSPWGLTRLPGLPPTRGLDLSYYFFDVGRVREKRLSCNPWLRGGLRLLRHGTRSPALTTARSLLASIFKELRGSPEPVLKGAAHYVLEKWKPITRADLEEIVCEVLAGEEQAVVSKAAEEYIALGEEKGIEKGIEKGERKEATRVLLRLLDQKFGRIPREFHRRIESASLALVDDWIGRILNAESIDQVFGNR